MLKPLVGCEICASLVGAVEARNAACKRLKEIYTGLKLSCDHTVLWKLEAFDYTRNVQDYDAEPRYEKTFHQEEQVYCPYCNTYLADTKTHPALYENSEIVLFSKEQEKFFKLGITDNRSKVKLFNEDYNTGFTGKAYL